MNNPNIEELYKKLTELAKAGDEKSARAFLTEHLKEFPAEVQEKIVFAFFQDALDKKVGIDEKISIIQKVGLDSINEIEAAEKVMINEDKISNVRASLGL